MEFGDKEWFEQAEKLNEFPSDFAFYVNPDKSVLSVCLNSNTKDIGSINYRKVINFTDSALIEVVNCKTPQEYFEACSKLRKVWM